MTDRPWLPYVLVAPSVLFLAALFLLPLGQTIWLSFSGPPASVWSTTGA
jgi:multiple sugar transport system permease protein